MQIYAHRSELDDIEAEMSFLLQSATNAVLTIIPKNVLNEYLDILVFFGSRSGLWCRHALVKLSEHLEIETFGADLARLPLHEFKLEYSLEGVWAAAEKVFSKMMSYITLDHIFLNLEKKCTPLSYENIVKIVHICLPLEFAGAAKPDRLLAQSPEENNKYFRFLFTDLWNLHPVLHPAIISRLEIYMGYDNIKPLIAAADLSDISPHTVTMPDGVKYLQRLQTLQRLDQLITIPAIVDLVKTSRSVNVEKRIQYSHTVVNAYSELMNLTFDVMAKADKITVQSTSFEAYVSLLMSSYTDLKGVVMYRQQVLARLADYIQCNPLSRAVVQAIGDEKGLEVLNHFSLLQTYVQHWNKFDQFLSPISLPPFQQPAQLDGASETPVEATKEKEGDAIVIGSPKRGYTGKRPKAPPPATPLQNKATLSVSVTDDERSSPSDVHDSYSDISESEEELLKDRKDKKKALTMAPAPPSIYDVPRDLRNRETTSESEDNDEARLLQRPPVSMELSPGLESRDPIKSPIIRIKHHDTSPNEYQHDTYLGHSSSKSRRHIPNSPPSSPPAYDERHPDAFHLLAESLEVGTRSVTKEQKKEMFPDAQDLSEEDEPKKKRADLPKPDITTIKGKATTGPSEHQIAKQLAPSGDLPEELRKMIAAQAQQLNFLVTQSFVVFPYRKEQAALFLRELQQTIMPALLKHYRLEALVDLPAGIEQLRYKYLEEFDFLGIPSAELSRQYYQFAELFFVMHYSDDVLMSADSIHLTDNVIRKTLDSLRNKWTVTPGFELLAFRRIAEMKHIIHPLDFGTWNVLALYVKIMHSPFVTHIEAQMQEVGSAIMPCLLRHYALPVIVPREVVRQTLKELPSHQEKELLGNFFESCFNLIYEAESTFPPYLDYLVYLGSCWVSFKLLLFERLRVYCQSYTTDQLTKHIAPLDPVQICLSDIDTRLLNDMQKQRLGEDLAVLFSLWDYKAFMPKVNNRTDINNQEYIDRKRALQDVLWGKYEDSVVSDWDVKTRGVHDKSWSLNIWLSNWPSTQDHALLQALKEGSAVIKSSPVPDRRFGNEISSTDIEMEEFPNRQISKQKSAGSRRALPLSWHELEGHPGVMWTGVIYRGIRLRLLKAVDRKSLDAVMGTIGSDVPAHAMWRFSNTVKEMEEDIKKAGVSDLKWGGLVMPIVFVVGNRSCPYQPEFLRYQKQFSKKEDDIFLCSGTVQPIYTPQLPSSSPQSTVTSNSRLRGVTNLLSATMTLFYDTPYIQNINRYSTYPKHMWTTLHAWSLAIYGIIFVWNMVQCAIGIDPDIGKFIIFGLWTIAVVFVSFFVELSVHSKSPKYVGQYHPGNATNLVVRTVMLIILLFFGLGQYYYAEKMVKGDNYGKCMPMGFADFIMINFISHMHIAVKHILFNKIYKPERPV